MARLCSSLFLVAVAVAVALVLAAAPSTLAGDPDYLQDICVADLNSGTPIKAVCLFKALLNPSVSGNGVRIGSGSARLGHSIVVSDALT